ncbi:MAG: helix-turn-helix domain-containing protein [Oscillospiraceae bacterium]|nr:helix-turn-helix domain-containing protein [Oscillospiraceae bacterium]
MTGNIYRQARETAGMTQQRWAEMLGVSAEAVKRYEAGGYLPADDVVLAMADISGLQILGTWHLRRKSAIGADVLPEVERLPLPQAVVQLLTALHIFDARHHADALLLIAADGRVEGEEEEARFEECMRDLQPLIAAAMQIGYAEGAP